jgi:ABC-2 type transport system ATP-binding protein
VEELLCDAQLVTQANEPVAEYSFGMRRKLSIIEAICHDPDLLILDEPSAGIDVAFSDLLAQWIHRRCERGQTTWVADNNADWLCRVATDAILLIDGRVEAAGGVGELMASVEARGRIDILLEHAGFNAVPNISGIESFRCEGNRISAQVHSNPDLPAELLAWITSCGGRVRSMEVCSVTLYEALIQRAARQEAQP